MPTKIYVDDDSKEEIAWLCGDNWDLAAQMSALEAWLSANQSQVPASRYIADIGFSVRPDASGGGAAISPRDDASHGRSWLYAISIGVSYERRQPDR